MIELVAAFEHALHGTHYITEGEMVNFEDITVPNVYLRRSW